MEKRYLSLLAIVFAIAISSVLAKNPVPYSAAALENEIKDLPGVPSGVDFRMFSGYITVGSGTKALFYWFVESQNDPANDPIALWTNGGPGCSGLSGFMTEQGPFRPTEGGNLTMNPYSWNKVLPSFSPSLVSLMIHLGCKHGFY